MSEHYTVYFNGPRRSIRRTTDITCEEYLEVEWLQVAITPSMETAADAERWADAWCGLGQATDDTTAAWNNDELREEAHQLGELYDLLAVDSLAAAIGAVRTFQNKEARLKDLLTGAREIIAELKDEAFNRPDSDPLHPTGHCTCGGGGECDWCQDAERRDDASSEHPVLDTGPTGRTYLEWRTELRGAAEDLDASHAGTVLQGLADDLAADGYLGIKPGIEPSRNPLRLDSEPRAGAWPEMPPLPPKLDAEPVQYCGRCNPKCTIRGAHAKEVESLHDWREQAGLESSDFDCALEDATRHDVDIYRVGLAAAWCRENPMEAAPDDEAGS